MNYKLLLWTFAALVALTLLGVSTQAFAQELPVVTIEAIDDLGSEDGDTITFRLTRSCCTQEDLFVLLIVAGTASPDDYTVTPPMLLPLDDGSHIALLPRNHAFIDFRLTPVDDDLVEGTETIVFVVSPVPGSYVPGPFSPVEATILDNDKLPVVTIEAIDAVGSEDGDTITFRVSRTGSTTDDLTVHIGFLGATGFVVPSEVNLVPPASGAGFIIPAGSAFLDILVTPEDDGLAEEDETLRLSVNPSDSYEVGDPSIADAIIVDRNAAEPTEPPTSEPDSTSPLSGEAPPVPLCNHIGDPEDAVVRAQAPDNAVTEGAVFCRVLNENGSFIGDVGHVGDANLIAQGVLQAVDVFGLTEGGDPVTRFNTLVYVCLRGSGDLFYADATNAPRVYVRIVGSIRDDFTCAAIPNAGTLVLARHASAATEV